LNPGNVLWIQPFDPNVPDDSGKVLGNPYRNRIYGPKKLFSLGKNNNVYELYFNAKFKKDHWKHNLELIKNFNIKLIRASPSVVQTIYSYFGDEYKFNCPLILSEETLYEDVRAMAESIFSSVIDKCMCWDGGLGWFECPFKTKHIYDEFCVVEQLPDDGLSLTDLQNLATPFFNYLNGDKGSIGKIECSCGLVGNYFKDFQGKIIEALHIENEAPIPGRYISEKLSGFFRLGKEYDFSGDNAFIDNDLNLFDRPTDFPDKFVYRIKQKENLEIDFYYNCCETLNEKTQKRINQFLNTIIWQNKNCKKINFIKDEEIFSKKNQRSKSLFIESDFIKKNINVLSRTDKTKEF
jgi:phenylacetate-coenzyme A ligase PaaK-like adenylate-forming protein